MLNSAKITALASKTLLAVKILSGVYTVTNVIRDLLKNKIQKQVKSWLDFTQHDDYLLLYCNYFVNVIFVLVMYKT